MVWMYCTSWPPQMAIQPSACAAAAKIANPAINNIARIALSSARGEP